MLNKLIAPIVGFILAVAAAGAIAANVDVNKASQAELESVKGIGPGLSTKMLEERKNGAFKDWGDLVGRVKGIGDGNAAKFSTEGLTVNGAGYTAAAAPVAKKAEKPAGKKDDKAGAQAAPVK
jgi:competence protein ComEA